MANPPTSYKGYQITINRASGCLRIVAVDSLGISFEVNAGLWGAYRAACGAIDEHLRERWDAPIPAQTMTAEERAELHSEAFGGY